MTADTQATTLYFGPWYRKSPFFEATLRYGCKAYDIYNHMYLPAYYDDPITEYWHLLNQVTLWDVAVERVGHLHADEHRSRASDHLHDAARQPDQRGRSAAILDVHDG